MSTNIEEDPKGFIDEMEKIPRVIQVSDTKGVEFVSYLLMDMAYQWYD